MLGAVAWAATASALVAGRAAAQGDSASAVAAGTASPPAASPAQAAPPPPARGFFRQATAFLQPGGVTANAISTPGGGRTVSGFNARITGAVATSVPWLTPFVGFQFQPNGLAGDRHNQPSAALGLAFTVVPPQATGGWLTVSVEPEGIYAPQPPGARMPYAVDLYGEAAFTLHIGHMLPPSAGQWLGMGAFLLVIQQATHAPRGPSGAHDYWAPALVYGLSLPIAPWR